MVYSLILRGMILRNHIYLANIKVDNFRFNDNSILLTYMSSYLFRPSHSSFGILKVLLDTFFIKMPSCFRRFDMR